MVTELLMASGSSPLMPACMEAAGGELPVRRLKTSLLRSIHARRLRMGFPLAALLALAFWFTVFPRPTKEEKPIVWVVPSLVRVGQNDSPGNGTRAELYAARGECESFQAVVRGSVNKLTNVNVAAIDFVSDGGSLIRHANVELYREQYVYVSRGSEDAGGSNRPRGPGWYADGLIPFFDPVTQKPPARAVLRAAPFEVRAGTNQPIWVDVCIPRDAVPGQYRGSLTVASDQGNVSVPVFVHVWNFELPLKPSLQTAFTIYNDRVSQPPVFYANQKANQEMLLRHRIMPVPVNHEDEREFIDKLGLNLGHLAFYPFATWGNCNQPVAPSVAELQSQRAVHQPDLPVFLQIADEVSDCPQIFPALRAWAKNAHSAGVMTLMTAIPLAPLRDDGSRLGRSAADIWVLLPKQFVSHPDDVAAAMRKKDQVWSYTALVQDPFSPKWAIDFDPINYRILGGFLNQSLGLRGLLYWSVNSWALEPRSDPWSRAQNLGPKQNYPPGEGMLVYPGGKVGLSSFAPSMRLKWIRDSVDDFEYVEVLRKLDQEDVALGVARAVAPDWTLWTRDPESLENARRKLGQEIDRLSSHRAAQP